MDLPVMPPVQPMLAKSVKDVPDPRKFDDVEHPGLLFEPKWDYMGVRFTAPIYDYLLRSRITAFAMLG